MQKPECLFNVFALGFHTLFGGKVKLRKSRNLEDLGIRGKKTALI